MNRARLTHHRPAAIAAAAILGFIVLVSTGLETNAQSSDPVFALGNPEIYKLDWNTRAMVAHDLNGDDRVDLAVINNDRGRIDLLYQKKPGKAERDARKKKPSRTWEPELEDARFRKESVVTGLRMFALAAGDLNGDGLTDLVFTGTPDGLTFLFQHPRDTWIDKTVLETEKAAQWVTTLAIEDLDGDGLDDLVVLGAEEVLVFHQSEGEMSDPRRYPLADDGCYGLLARDMDGDGRIDLSYLAPKSRYAWRVRFQREGGDFGPERSFRMDSPLRHLEPLAYPADGRLVFASVQAKTGLIDLADLAASDEAEGIRLAPRVYSTPSADNTKGSFTLGDFDGDALIDLAVGDGRGAQVWLYTQLEDGSFARPTAFPSLSGVRSLASGDVDGDGRAEMFVVSPGERALGMSRLSPEGRLSYPKIIWGEGKPLAVAAADLDGDGVLEIATAIVGNGTRSVLVLEPADTPGRWSERFRVDLDGLRTDPAALEVMDANQDGRSDLAVYTLQSPMRLLLQGDDGTFRDITSDEGFRRGLVDGVEAGAMSLGDVTGDGKDEMLLAGEGFARAMTVDEDGAITVIDQFNARSREDAVAVALSVELKGDGEPEVLLVQQGGEQLQILERDRHGVYRHAESVPVGRIEVVGAAAVDLAADGRSDVIVLGEDRFWCFPLRVADLDIRAVATHEPELDDMSYVDLVAGDLDGDGRDDLLAVDSRGSRMLEILTWDDDGWSGVYHFTIFEVDPSYQGRQGSATEPRQVLLSDLTSDGKLDVALLIHDRVLVYPGLSMHGVRP